MYIAFMFAAMGTGESCSGPATVNARTVECPLSAPSVWGLVRFEEDGKGETRRGKLTLDKKGLGTIAVFPRADWKITASRINGNGQQGSFELDIQWKSE